MMIRHARLEDLSMLVQICNECYPPEERISEIEYKHRWETYPQHFWIMEEQKEILAFINGPVTDHSRIQDVMFHDPRIHNENGKWQAILAPKSWLCFKADVSADWGCKKTKSQRLYFNL